MMENMDIRNYFAAKALQGLTSTLDINNEIWYDNIMPLLVAEDISKICFIIADAMIDESKKAK